MKSTKIPVEFMGLPDLYVFSTEGDTEIKLGTNGPIATQSDWENFDVGFAHLFRDGKIKRYYETIGQYTDLKQRGPVEEWV